MGTEITQDSFSADDHRKFSQKLHLGLAALKKILADKDFGAGPCTIGAELELVLIDNDGNPLLRNQEVLANSSDPRLTLELNRFNLEINLSPVALAGKPFTHLKMQFHEGLLNAELSAATLNGLIGSIGILPTLEPGDLQTQALTRKKRYTALNTATKKLRKAPFHLQIAKEEALDCELDSVAAEGANTSMQLHLKVTPAQFSQTYNAAQIATAAVLAVAGNSPYFFQKKLWEETRIPLFRQSIDTRGKENQFLPARVSFGHGWVREGAWELFAESVYFHSPLLPVISEENPEAVLREGGLPKLSELCLHHGTVWSWNRAVYDPAHGGNLRIEFRALPAGPTSLDMTANAAFLLGLTLAIAGEIDAYLNRLTFAQAKRNFYKAARDGLDAEMRWPSFEGTSPLTISARELLPQLVKLAHRGLVEHGVDAAEAQYFLAIIDGRLKSEITGARWQTTRVAELEKQMDRKSALATMVREYLVHGKSGHPVHLWGEPNVASD